MHGSVGLQQADEPRRAGLNRAPVGEQRGEGHRGCGGARGNARGVLEPHASDGCSHRHQQVADQACFDRALQHDQNLFPNCRLRPGNTEFGNAGRHREGEVDREGGAGSRHARHADAAAHLVDQALGDGEPKPGAAMPSRRTLLGLLELGEDAADGVGLHARSGIAHGEAQQGPVPGAARRAGSEPKRQAHAAGRRELDGIAHEIHQDLADAHLVADHRVRQIGRRQPADFQTLVAGPRRQ